MHAMVLLVVIMMLMNTIVTYSPIEFSRLETLERMEYWSNQQYNGFRKNTMCSIKQPQVNILFHSSSEYNGDVIVVEYNRRRIMYFSVSTYGVVRQSQIDILNRHVLLDEYTQIMAKETIQYLSKRMNKLTIRVLNIGLGGGILPEWILFHVPHVLVTSVDIDNSVINAAEYAFGVSNTSRHTIIAMNAAEYIKSSPDNYDIVWIDGFSSQSIGTPIEFTTSSLYVLLYVIINLILYCNLVTKVYRELYFLILL
jgi:precorrin-6B methylase 2